MRVSPVPTNLISPMLSHPGPDKNHVNLMLGCIGSRVSTSSSGVLFLQPLRQKMTPLYANSVDVNVKNRMAVAGGVFFFKLE